MVEKQRRSKALIPTLVILLLALGVAGYYWRRSRPKQLVLSGTIERHTVHLGSLTGGRVTEVLVEEGTPVGAGQPLVTFDTEPIDKQLAEQQTAIDFARANLDRVAEGSRSEDITKAAILSAATTRERKRMASLFREGVASRQAYDRTLIEEKTAAAELKKVRSGSRDEEVAASRAQLEREIRRLETLKQQRGESSVASPVAGTVQAVAVRPGDLVAPNQPVVEIVEQKEMWVTVYVPETLMGLVRIGMQATIRVDSFRDKAFSGRVHQIAAEAEYTPRNVQTRNQRADQVFAVKVVVDPSPELKPGMAADVDLGVKGKA